MTNQSIGVAVIGGGMAGRAHAAGYRSATTLFGTDRPDVRLVAIADTNAAVADDTARRYGYERAEYDWRAIAEAPDIDAVSVVVANHLHREIVEGLLAAGKHVLCEKPLAGSLADAEAMVAAAERSDRVTAVGYTYRRSPAVEQIRRELAAGTIGELVHFNGHYWCDYALDPTVADHLAIQGRPRHRRPGRRRQSPDRPQRVRLRADHRSRRRRLRDVDQGAARAARGHLRPHQGRRQ